MTTFACACQTITTKGGQTLRFETAADDHSVCTLSVGSEVLKFQRNGGLLSVSEAAPPAAAAAKEPADGVSDQQHEESQPVGARQSARHGHSPKRHA